MAKKVESDDWADVIREKLVRLVSEGQISLYAVAKETGLNYASVHTFHDGKNLSTKSLTKLGRMIGFELREVAK